MEARMTHCFETSEETFIGCLDISAVSWLLYLQYILSPTPLTRPSKCLIIAKSSTSYSSHTRCTNPGVVFLDAERILHPNSLVTPNFGEAGTVSPARISWKLLENRLRQKRLLEKALPERWLQKYRTYTGYVEQQTGMRHYAEFFLSRVVEACTKWLFYIIFYNFSFQSLQGLDYCLLHGTTFEQSFFSRKFRPNIFSPLYHVCVPLNIWRDEEIDRYRVSAVQGISPGCQWLWVFSTTFATHRSINFCIISHHPMVYGQ